MPYLWERLLGNTDGKGSNGGGASTSLRLHNVCIERGQIKYVCFWRRGGISVERLTRRLEYGRACFNSNLYGRINKEVCERLAAIEDILGDDYDLDRLKELVEADREGRCVVLSDGSYTDKDGEEALKNAMFILSLTNDGINRYIADAIAEKLVREESEAALKKMKRGNE